MVVDKDLGRVYDLRNERHVERLTESEIVKSSTKSVVPGTDPFEIAEAKSVLIRPQSSKAPGKPSGWGNWWQKKKENNEALLLAAEKGDLANVKKYLSPE